MKTIIFIVIAIISVSALTYYSSTYKYDVGDTVSVISCSSDKSTGRTIWTGKGRIKEKIFSRKYRVECIEANFAMKMTDYGDITSYPDLILNEEDIVPWREERVFYEKLNGELSKLGWSEGRIK